MVNDDEEAELAEKVGVDANAVHVAPNAFRVGL